MKDILSVYPRYLKLIMDGCCGRWSDVCREENEEMGTTDLFYKQRNERNSDFHKFSI